MPDRNTDREKATPLEIMRASASDVPTVWGVIQSCAEWLSTQNFHHWNRYYTQKMVSKMVAKKEVHMGLVNGNVVGTVTFDTKPPKYYLQEGYNHLFTNPEEAALYVTAVAVLPGEQKKGYAGKLLQFVEDQARERNIGWLRLDCRVEAGLVEYYEKYGYTAVGPVIDEGEDGTYRMMEKGLWR